MSALIGHEKAARILALCFNERREELEILSKDPVFTDSATKTSMIAMSILMGNMATTYSEAAIRMEETMREEAAQ